MQSNFPTLVRIFVIAITIFSPEIVAAAKGVEAVISGEKSRVQFLATGNTGIKIRGEMKDGSAIKGKMLITAKSMIGRATLDLNALKTGISLRDKHMKEKYLETNKYPKAQFDLKKLAIPASFHEGNFNGVAKFEGTMTIRGIKKPIKDTVRLSKSGNQLTMNFNFPVKTSDYQIKTPSFMGITVTNTVKLDVEITMPLKPKR